MPKASSGPAIGAMAHVRAAPLDREPPAQTPDRRQVDREHRHPQRQHPQTEDWQKPKTTAQDQAAAEEKTQKPRTWQFHMVLPEPHGMAPARLRMGIAAGVVAGSGHLTYAKIVTV